MIKENNENEIINNNLFKISAGKKEEKKKKEKIDWGTYSTDMKKIADSGLNIEKIYQSLEKKVENRTIPIAISTTATNISKSDKPITISYSITIDAKNFLDYVIGKITGLEFLNSTLINNGYNEKILKYMTIKKLTLFREVEEIKKADENFFQNIIFSSSNTNLSLMYPTDTNLTKVQILNLDDDKQWGFEFKNYKSHVFLKVNGAPQYLISTDNEDDSDVFFTRKIVYEKFTDTIFYDQKSLDLLKIENGYIYFPKKCNAYMYAEVSFDLYDILKMEVDLQNFLFGKIIQTSSFIDVFSIPILNYGFLLENIQSKSKINLFLENMSNIIVSDSKEVKKYIKKVIKSLKIIESFEMIIKKIFFTGTSSINDQNRIYKIITTFKTLKPLSNDETLQFNSLCNETLTLISYFGKYFNKLKHSDRFDIDEFESYLTYFTPKFQLPKQYISIYNFWMETNKEIINSLASGNYMDDDKLIKTKLDIISKKFVNMTAKKDINDQIKKLKSERKNEAFNDIASKIILDKMSLLSSKRSNPELILNALIENKKDKKYMPIDDESTVADTNMASKKQSVFKQRIPINRQGNVKQNIAEPKDADMEQLGNEADDLNMGVNNKLQQVLDVSTYEDFLKVTELIPNLIINLNQNELTLLISKLTALIEKNPENTANINTYLVLAKKRESDLAHKLNESFKLNKNL